MADAARQFQYAILRVVPRVERGEAVNAGVVLYSGPHRFLEARTTLDEQLFAAFAPACDITVVRRHLAGIERIAAGDANAGPIAQLSQSERFHWIVAPSSTIIQPSPVHIGLTADPAETLASLFASLVARG